MSDFQVYTGFWTNLEKGRIVGRTLTLPSNNALFLSIFLTLFVRFTGARLWNIVAFFIHQVRSSSQFEDGLYHQHQAILRNKESDIGALFALTKLGWEWKNKTNGVLRRSFVLITIAMLHAGLLLTAALFSKEIATASGNQVLLAGNALACGFVDAPNVVKPSLEDMKLMGKSYTLTLRLLQNSFDHVRACYRGKRVSSAGCDFYTRPFLTSTETAYNCPFTEEVCGNSTWIQYDSGLIESDHDLGINAAPEDQIKIRKWTSCGVIGEKQFESNVTVDSNTWIEYNLGPTNQTNFTYVTDSDWRSFTWQQYKLGVVGAYADAAVPNFVPIESLQVADSDLTFLFMENLAMYPVDKISDPFFSADVLHPADEIDGLPTPYYMSNKIVSILACTEQYQLCTSQSKCTPRAGFITLNSARPAVSSLGMNPTQKAIYDLVWNGTSAGTVYASASTLGDQLLLARSALWGTESRFSSPLPSTQWETEVQNLHNLSLASMQLNIVAHISPASLVETESDGLELDIIHGVTEEERELCHTQLVRSDAHLSFSILGLSFILVLGFLIMVLSIVLDRFICWLRRNAPPGSRNEARRTEWIAGELLQLLRASFEERGFGPWVGKTKSVPVTEAYGVKFPFKSPATTQLEKLGPYSVIKTEEVEYVQPPVYGYNYGYEDQYGYGPPQATFSPPMNRY